MRKSKRIARGIIKREKWSLKQENKRKDHSGVKVSGRFVKFGRISHF